MNILICGLTGSGKTTLANALAPLIGATIFDGDTVRDSYPNPLGFSEHDRILHARHMRVLCGAVTAGGNHAIASFVCPTHATRAAFAADYMICCTDYGDRLYADTQAMWDLPADADLYATKSEPVEFWADRAAAAIQPVFNPMSGTALFVGRYQPFHAGHKALIVEGIKKYGQACIGVRDHSRDWPFSLVKQRIDAAMRNHVGKYTVIPLPNIAAICYGRDVGYNIQRIELPLDVESISGTKLREITSAHANGTPHQPSQ